MLNVMGEICSMERMLLSMITPISDHNVVIHDVDHNVVGDNVPASKVNLSR